MKSVLLLKTMLLSTSQVNLYRHTGDKKKKSRIIGNFAGLVILYAMLMAYCAATCIGYGEMGLISSAPVLCALTISALAFMLTLLKTNGYLFNFREHDMLMSLPFRAETVAACKFLYMYVKSLPWNLSIAVAMLIGYSQFVHPFVIIYPVWLLLSLFLPVIPMLIASFLGFLIARISTGFKKTNVVQTVMMFVVILAAFSSRFVIEYLFKNDQVEATLEMLSEATGKAGRIYLPASWFSDAVAKREVLPILLLAGISVVLFAVVFRIVGGSYRNINSALKTHAAAGRYKLTAQKQRPVVLAIAYKELKRLTGSTVYMTNAAIGELLVTILGIITLVFGADRIISVVTAGAPVNSAMLEPAIPLIIYFFLGMMATTVCSPSLEGKNYWIVQSLPLEKKTLYQGKMLFNMLLTVPFMVFSTLCLCISAKVPVLLTILYLMLGFALCAFSTAWGCVCGVKHMRLDWENEVEVVKQGAAVAIYLLPNMFAVMGITVLAVILGMRINHALLALIMILITAVLAGLSYQRVMALANKQY